MNEWIMDWIFFSFFPLKHFLIIEKDRKENDEEKIKNHESRIKKILASYASLKTHTHTHMFEEEEKDYWRIFSFSLLSPISNSSLLPPQELQIDSWFFFFQIIMMMIIWFVVVVVVFVTHTEENRATNTILYIQTNRNSVYFEEKKEINFKSYLINWVLAQKQNIQQQQQQRNKPFFVHLEQSRIKNQENFNIKLQAKFCSFLSFFF